MKGFARSLSVALALLAPACTDSSGSDVQAARDVPPSMCFAVGTAIEEGDVEALTWLNLPATMEVDLLAGDIANRVCASDDLTDEYVMAITRTSGQIVIVRNTTRNLLSNEAQPTGDAIEAIGTDLGVRLVEGDSVVRLRGTKTGVPADPIGAILR